MWFLDDPERFLLERRSIDALAGEAWFEGVRWGYRDEVVTVCVSVGAHGHTCRLELTYPEHFPSVPPSIKPVDPTFRLSDHQYANGVLCTEYGADTWTPDFTGADVMVSARRLIESDNPRGNAVVPATPVPSRHRLTLGQEVRSSHGRVVVGYATVEFLAALPSGTVGLLRGRIRYCRHGMVLTLVLFVY